MAEPFPERILNQVAAFNNLSRGDLIPLFHHDFSEKCGIPWMSTNQTSSNGSAELSLTDAPGLHLTGESALKIVTPAGAGFSEKFTELHMFPAKIPDNPVQYFGGNFAFMDENAAYLSLYNGHSTDATHWYSQSLTHALATDIWSVQNGGTSAGNLTLFTRESVANTAYPRWHPFLLVASFDPQDATKSRQIDIQIDEFSNAYGYGTSRANKDAIPAIPIRQVAEATVLYHSDFALEIGYTGGTPVASTILFDELWAIAGPER